MCVFQDFRFDVRFHVKCEIWFELFYLPFLAFFNFFFFFGFKNQYGAQFILHLPFFGLGPKYLKLGFQVGRERDILFAVCSHFLFGVGKKRDN